MVELHVSGFVTLFLALLCAPMLLSIINRTKAWFAGRQGPPWLQPYHDLKKMLGKGAVYSRTTTWMVVAGPVVGLACTIACLTLLPWGGFPSVLTFSGDIILLAYLLGLMRFFTVLAALDTGSSFEGMGASREVTFSALAEPTLFFGFSILAYQTGSLSLTGMAAKIDFSLWLRAGPVLALVACAWFAVFLSENARIPVDDPNTHLELTMIHEVMVLDHGGIDLAFIMYGAALKMWILGSLLICILIPVGTPLHLSVPAALAGMFLLAVLTGIIESVMARLRLNRVPQMLVGAMVLAALALILLVR